MSSQGQRLWMKVVFLWMLLGCVIVQTACSTEPVYYSEKQVENYVSKVYGDAWELTDIVNEHEYQFTNDSGLTFSVYADNEKPISMDGASASVYVKSIRDNYFAAIFDQHREEIDALAEEQGFSVKFSSNITFRAYLLINSLDDAEAAAEVIAEMDALLDYQCNYRKTRLHIARTMEKEVTCVLCLEPEDAGEYWWTVSDNQICKFTFSTNAKKRLSEKKCLRIIRVNS